MLYSVWRTWWCYWNYLPNHHFFSKWLPFRENVNFVWLQWKLISWGNLTWRTWWYHRNFVPSHHFFFQNGRHIAKISTLSDFNENWYLGVYWCGDHDGTMEIFFEIATILHKCHLCPILRKNYSLECFDVVNMMVLSKHFSQLSIFFRMAAMSHKCHLCLISKKKWLPFSRIGFQVSDIGSSRASCFYLSTSHRFNNLKTKAADLNSEIF